MQRRRRTRLRAGVRPNAVQVVNEPGQFGFVQGAVQEVVQGIHRLVERFDEREALFGDLTPNTPTLLGTALARDPALSLHAVDQARDARRAFDHVLTDGQRRQSLFSRTA